MANVESGYKGCWWTMLLGAAVLLMAGMRECYGPESKTEVVHDTVWRDTTIYQPVAAETINAGRVVYIKVPVAVPQPQTRPDTVHDSIEVPVPIVQKRYEDSLYTAWVSGYEPALDSIRLYLPEVTTTITETVVQPAPLITFGIQAGAGYGVFNRKPDIYIGVGGQINLWRK